MPLISFKIYLELNWIEVCILSSAGYSAKLKITDTKLHVPIITLSTQDNVNLKKQLSDGFKRSVYWNNYSVHHFKLLKHYLFLFMLLLKMLQIMMHVYLKIWRNENCKVLLGGRNVYDQLINGLIKQNDEVRKVSTWQCDDYTTGFLIVYACSKDNYRLIAVDLSKQKALDPDIRANQQVLFQGVLGGADNTKIRLFTILEISKVTALELFQWSSESFVRIYK